MSDLIEKVKKHLKEQIICESKKDVSASEYKKLIKNGWKSASEESDIPDEKEVEWVWSKDMKKFAWRMDG